MADPTRARRHLLFVRGVDGEAAPPAADGEATWILEPRGVGRSRWTVRNPPNHVERAMALLGDTVAAGRIRDTLAAIAVVRDSSTAGPAGIRVAGRGAAGVVAADAALFAPQVDAVTLLSPPASHMADDAPALLDVLRVADIAVILGLLAPRRLELDGVDAEAFADTAAIYATAGAAERIRVTATEGTVSPGR